MATGPKGRSLHARTRKGLQLAAKDGHAIANTPPNLRRVAHRAPEWLSSEAQKHYVAISSSPHPQLA